MSIELLIGILGVVGVIGSALISNRRFAKRDVTDGMVAFMKTLQDDQAALRADNRALRTEVDELRDENRKLCDEVDALRDELTSAKRRITELETENSRLRGMLKHVGNL